MLAIANRRARALTLLGCTGLLAGALLAAAHPAQAATPAAAALKCGATITRSVTLSRDITCTTSAKPAITIGAAGLTINLNGHTIHGPGDTQAAVGILDNGHNNLTIESGTIANFYADVYVDGTSTTSEVSGLRIKNMTLTDNSLGNQSYGVFGHYLHEASLTGLSIKNGYFGVDLDTSQRCTVTASNLTGQFEGFVDTHGTANSWTHSTMSNISFEGVALGSTVKAVVTTNTITGADAVGVLDESSTGALIAHNTFTGMFTGVEGFGETGTTISANTGSGDVYGIYTGSDKSGDTVVGNVFSKGQYGIEADFPAGVLIRANTTDSNSIAGIFVYTSQRTTGYSATLSHNTANKNHFGLYSQIHTKGGSNHAAGNTVVNCHNVACVKG